MTALHTLKLPLNPWQLDPALDLSFSFLLRLNRCDSPLWLDHLSSTYINRPRFLSSSRHGADWEPFLKWSLWIKYSNMDWKWLCVAVLSVHRVTRFGLISVFQHPGTIRLTAVLSRSEDECLLILFNPGYVTARLTDCRAGLVFPFPLTVSWWTRCCVLLCILMPSQGQWFKVS